MKYIIYFLDKKRAIFRLIAEEREIYNRVKSADT